jgi:DUF4097 and DUF4098 domain-containing protein YvlB
MKNRDMKKGLAVPLILAFVVTIGSGLALGRERYEEKFTKTEALAKDGKVYLANISGDIEIKSWKEDQVKIEALKVSEAASMDKAKENAALVPIEVTREAGVLRIETKYPKDRHEWGGRDSINVSVNYKIWIPEKAAIEVKSVSGDVNLASIGGAAKINSVSGNVDVLGAAGVEVNLVSGDIELRDVSEARTVTGKTVSGNIDYIGTIMAGGNYELKAHSGNVVMTIPANSSFDLEASTFSGVIDSDFQIQVVGKISPKEIRGTVNQGGARVRAKSFSGNVEIRKH